MRRLVLVTVAIVMLSGLAQASEHAGRPDAHQRDTPVSVGKDKDAAAPVRLAMGPVSAAHVPGGNGGSPGNYSSQAADPLPVHRKKLGRIHRHSSRG